MGYVAVMARQKKTVKSAAVPHVPVQVQPVAPNVLDGIPFKTVSGVASVGSSWVLQLNFTETMMVDTATAVQKPAAVVSMPWNLAKALHEILGNQIAAYEKQEGEIRLPKAFVHRPGKP
jgi:hypothetical protein